MPSGARKRLSAKEASLARSGDGLTSYPVGVGQEEEDDSNQSRYGGDEAPSPGYRVTFLDFFSVDMTPEKPDRSMIDEDDHDSTKLDRLQQRLEQADASNLAKQLSRTGEILDEAMMRRWLHGRSVENTIEDLKEHAAWRQDFVGTNHHGITEELIRPLLEANIIFLQGNDDNGYPIVVFVARNYDAGLFSSLIPYLMAYAIDGALLCADPKLNPKRQMKWIFDLSNVSRKNISVEFLEKLFTLLQDNYPECLNHLYYVNAPFLFRAIWSCVVAFISAETRQKISFISNNGSECELVNIFGKNSLPTHYGGHAPWRPVEASIRVIRTGGTLQNTEFRDINVTDGEIQAPRFSLRSIKFWLVFLLALIYLLGKLYFF
eukprot:jgi/Picsp_1/870/NSC_04358-R1_protein